MSRAFVKEDDSTPEKPLARGASDNPNYVTPEGLRQLKSALAEAESGGNERDAVYLRSRISDAIVVKRDGEKSSEVQIGASVTIAQPDGVERTYRIVGEDEADPLAGNISWISPLAQALLGAKRGDTVLWERPAGILAVTIRAIKHDA